MNKEIEKATTSSTVDSPAFLGRLTCCILAPDKEKGGETAGLIAHIDAHTAAAVAAERERAARLALQWSNARNPEAGGHALRNYAQALRDGVEVCEDESRDYHWSKAAAQQHAQAALSDAVALAWKWHREAVKDGFACSEPAQELFELFGWPDDPDAAMAAQPGEKARGAT